MEIVNRSILPWKVAQTRFEFCENGSNIIHEFRHNVDIIFSVTLSLNMLRHRVKLDFNLTEGTEKGLV